MSFMRSRRATVRGAGRRYASLRMAGRNAHPHGRGPIAHARAHRPRRASRVAPRPGRARARCASRPWSGSSSTRPTRTTTRYYSLLWGREVLHLHAAGFEVYRAPTEHPLAIAFGALLSLLGARRRPRDGRARRSASFVVAGRRHLPARPHRVHAARRARRRRRCCCTRFDFPFLAARGYIDIPYLALVVWAAALEAERPRRGVPVFVLLACAGLLRPEAWLLIGLYWLWCALAGAPGAQRLRVRRAGGDRPGRRGSPIDCVVTGDPLFSLHHTSRPGGGARAHARACREVPARDVGVLRRTSSSCRCCSPAIAGSSLAICARRRGASCVPLVAAGASGSATFVLVGVAGLSVIDRYLLVAVADGHGLRRRRARRLDDARARALLRDARGWWRRSLVVVSAACFTATRVNLRAFDTELALPRRRARARSSGCSTTRGPGRRCAAGRCRRRTTSWSPTRAGSSTAPARRGRRAQPTRAPTRKRSRTRRRDLRRRAATRCCARRSRPDDADDVASRLGAAARLHADRDERLLRGVCDAAERLYGALGPSAAPRRPAAASLGVSRCASGASSTACPTPTTPTRTRTSSRSAIGLFGHGWNPHYFVNPPAYTYLLHVVFASGSAGATGVVARVSRPTRPRSSSSPASPRRCSGRWPCGCCTSPARGCSTAASACSPRRCSAVAFLPVFYSHLALNDVPTLAPICLAL